MKSIIPLTALAAVLTLSQPAIAESKHQSDEQHSKSPSAKMDKTKNEKVELCHQTMNFTHVVLNLPPKAANQHIENHGDFLPVTFYEDSDGDGLGNSDVYFSSCEDSVAGYVLNGDDLDDNDPYVNPPDGEGPGDGVDEGDTGGGNDDDL